MDFIFGIDLISWLPLIILVAAGIILFLGNGYDSPRIIIFGFIIFGIGILSSVLEWIDFVFKDAPYEPAFFVGIGIIPVTNVLGAIYLGSLIIHIVWILYRLIEGYSIKIWLKISVSIFALFTLVSIIVLNQTTIPTIFWLLPTHPSWTIMYGLIATFLLFLGISFHGHEDSSVVFNFASFVMFFITILSWTTYTQTMILNEHPTMGLPIDWVLLIVPVSRGSISMFFFLFLVSGIVSLATIESNKKIAYYAAGAAILTFILFLITLISLIGYQTPIT
jgi:hypothetical protein